MIRQPEWGTRNVNKYFYESEARRIAELNEIFGDIELTAAEMRTLLWLRGWEECTVKNVLSAKVTKPMRRIRRRLPGQGERILIEANDQLYDRKRLCQP